MEVKEALSNVGLAAGIATFVGGLVMCGFTVANIASEGFAANSSMSMGIVTLATLAVSVGVVGISEVIRDK